VKLDGRKQAQALPPNFVHSLDAAALKLTICTAQDRGLTAFAAIHDSYGTLAADMQSLLDTLRECFVSMYQTDVLSVFRSEVGAVLPEGKELPAVPAAGSLDLNGVLRSDFFFA
jgi:DNA-directed RNA polymerase